LVGHSLINPDEAKPPEECEDGSALRISQAWFGKELLLRNRRVIVSLVGTLEITPVGAAVEIGDENVRVD
jgi:hypothetical protein